MKSDFRLLFELFLPAGSLRFREAVMTNLHCNPMCENAKILDRIFPFVRVQFAQNLDSRSQNCGQD